MDDKDYLIHYGVLGMKWGVRKDRKKSNFDFIKSNRNNGVISDDAKNPLRKRSDFIESAKSKKMKKYANRANTSFDRYDELHKQNYKSSKTRRAEAKFTKDIEKLKSVSRKEADKLLGRYSKKNIEYLQSYNERGEIFYAKAKANDILSLALVDIALENDRKKK